MIYVAISTTPLKWHELMNEDFIEGETYFLWCHAGRLYLLFQNKIIEEMLALRFIGMSFSMPVLHDTVLARH